MIPQAYDPTRPFLVVSAEWDMATLMRETLRRAPPPPNNFLFGSLVGDGARRLVRWRDGEARPTRLWREFRARAVKKSPCLILLHAYPILFGGAPTEAATIEAAATLLVPLGQQLGAVVMLMPSDNAPQPVVVLAPSADHPIVVAMLEAGDTVVMGPGAVTFSNTVH